MITQELRDYVQGRISAGVSREQITADLLNQGGWTREQAQEAFEAAQTSVPVAPAPQPTGVVEMTQPPKNIKRFEWLMYGAVGGSVLVLVLQAAIISYSLASTLVGAIVPLLGWLLRLVFVYLVVYRRVEWARIALTVLFAFSLFGTPTLFFITFNPLFWAVLIPMALEAAAIYYVFKTDSSTWLVGYQPSIHGSANSSPDSAVTLAPDAGPENTYWAKWIPAVNGLFMFGVLIMMFIVNVIILLTDSLGLGLGTMAFFYAIMFIPTGIFAAFYFHEQRTLVNRYQRSHSRLDPWLLILIVLRNTAFVASVIPFIQIIGMGALILGGVPYLIVYYFLLRARNKVVAAV